MLDKPDLSKLDCEKKKQPPNTSEAIVSWSFTAESSHYPPCSNSQILANLDMVPAQPLRILGICFRQEIGHENSPLTSEFSEKKIKAAQIPHSI